MKNIKALHHFLSDYLTWVDAGAPEKNDYGFCRGSAICDNLWDWEHYPENMHIVDMTKALRSLFRRDGLCASYPFNPDSIALAGSFDKEMEEGTHHLNKQRIEWVRKWVAKLGVGL